MTDNDLTVETTARVGEHTATIRVLDTGAVKLTPRMAAQLDRIRIGEIDPFGRVVVRSAGKSEDVILGKNAHGDLVTAAIPNHPIFPLLTCSPARPGRLGSDGDSAYGLDLTNVMFEGRQCTIHAFLCEPVTDGSLAEDQLDPNGNEVLFREQIAEHDRTVALREELLRLPRILLRED